MRLQSRPRAYAPRSSSAVANSSRASRTFEISTYVSPSFGGSNLLMTNLTGHPSVVVPNGFNEEGSPVSITFMGRLFDEGTVLAVARTYQNATDFHLKHPDNF